MGSAIDYLCTSCGYRAERVTPRFDYGFSSEVITPVVCTEHGIQTAETGLMARDEGWKQLRGKSYPCPECGKDSPLWNRRKCPKCGHRPMVQDGDFLMWD